MAKQKIEVWVDEQDLARIDQARGLAARSAWAREIIHGAVSDERHHHGVPTVTIDAGNRTIGGKGIRVTKLEGATAGGGDMPKHRHRYEREGEPLRHEKGEPVYLRICACGATKEGN